LQMPPATTDMRSLFAQRSQAGESEISTKRGKLGVELLRSCQAYPSSSEDLAKTLPFGERSLDARPIQPLSSSLVQQTYLSSLPIPFPSPLLSTTVVAELTQHFLGNFRDRTLKRYKGFPRSPVHLSGIPTLPLPGQEQK
jgi:hypothetical protein